MGITFAAFLGACATHCADTLATEIGLLNPTPPRLITKPWETVPAGTSGGVSLMGEIATILGSILIGGMAAFLAAPFWYALIGAPPLFELVNFAPVTMVLVALFGGLVGCTIDSLFGATIQGHWRCQVCSKKTEKKVHCGESADYLRHCGESADYLRGNRFFDNNMVNLVSGLIGAIAAILLYLTLLGIGFA
jgi:uncharacterized membrane protein